MGCGDGFNFEVAEIKGSKYEMLECNLNDRFPGVLIKVIPVPGDADGGMWYTLEPQNKAYPEVLEFQSPDQRKDTWIYKLFPKDDRNIDLHAQFSIEPVVAGS